MTGNRLQILKEIGEEVFFEGPFNRSILAGVQWAAREALKRGDYAAYGDWCAQEARLNDFRKVFVRLSQEPTTAEERQVLRDIMVPLFNLTVPE